MVARNRNDIDVAHLQYTKARNKVKRLLRKAKISFEREIAQQSKTNPKAFWSHTRQKLKTKSVVVPLLSNPKDKDSIKSDDAEKANIILQQFSSVFINESNGNIPRIENRTNSTILDLHVTNLMVLKQLMNLNVNKSCGPDEIHPRLLIELSEHIARPVALLFNMTMKHGFLPTDWKRALVSPIYKDGSRNLVENYQPISLTSILCKMMESFVRDTVVTHLLEKRLLMTKQYVFISERSTTTQLLNYLDKCVKTIVGGGVVDAIYLDFSKAFDTVPHRRLIGKLEAYGIKGNILKWIRGFLDGRIQQIMVNGVKSEIAPVISGIPHGTVLGPVLFDGLMFADDTKIFCHITSREDALALQSDI